MLPGIHERSQLNLIAIFESVPDLGRRAEKDVSDLPMPSLVAEGADNDLEKPSGGLSVL